MPSGIEAEALWVSFLGFKAYRHPPLSPHFEVLDILDLEVLCSLEAPNRARHSRCSSSPSHELCYDEERIAGGNGVVVGDVELHYLMHGGQQDGLHPAGDVP